MPTAAAVIKMPTAYFHMDRLAGVGEAVADRTRGRSTPDGIARTLISGCSWLGRGTTKSGPTARDGMAVAGGGIWRGAAVGLGGQTRAGIGMSEGRGCGTGGAARAARFRATRSLSVGGQVRGGADDTGGGMASAAAQRSQTGGPSTAMNREHRAQRRRSRSLRMALAPSMLPPFLAKGHRCPARRPAAQFHELTVARAWHGRPRRRRSWSVHTRVDSARASRSKRPRPADVHASGIRRMLRSCHG